jgi:hypothetical protein
LQLGRRWIARGRPGSITGGSASVHVQCEEWPWECMLSDVRVRWRARRFAGCYTEYTRLAAPAGGAPDALRCAVARRVAARLAL